MLDIHSHMVFDVDDGSRSLGESQEMLAAAKRVGLTEIYCTPHCSNLSFNRHKIEQNFEIFKESVVGMGVDLQLGFEVYWKTLMDIGFEHIAELCLGKSKLFLLEFSLSAMPANWQRFIYSVAATGVRPIIAHPERYRAVQHDIKIVEEMRRLGCRIQLSANFMSVSRFHPIRRTALALIKAGYVDYIASDAHSVADYAFFSKALAQYERLRVRQ